MSIDILRKALKVAKEDVEFHFANYEAMQQQLQECRKMLEELRMANNTMADYWYQMYLKADEENIMLKKKAHTLSRIDVIGQNGNEGTHYEELLLEVEKLKKDLYGARVQNDLYKHNMES
jgi:ribosomal protein L29